MDKRVAIIGGGVAGLGAALSLDRYGIESIIIEKSPNLGGKVTGYAQLFPDFKDGKALVAELIDKARRSPRIKVLTNASIRTMARQDGRFELAMTSGDAVCADAVILTCGFEVFDARKQGEYGYGVYPNVITAPELELFLDPEGPTKGKLLRPSDGQPAQRVAIIFCVGSRNKRLGNPYCSRICCSYSTKQAIEIMERHPDANVTCFYMDIRTYGRGFEEMYQYAQELGVKYVRGRVSECSALPNGDIQVRAENTLMCRPVQGAFDVVSLSVGMAPCSDGAQIAAWLGLELDPYGFFQAKDDYLSPYETHQEGVFLAGSISGLKPIRDCLSDGFSAGGEVALYLQRSHQGRG